MCVPPLFNQVAETLRKEPCFYFPHSIDFRGRAYPIHAYLNHLGHDVNRGMLQFARAQPLGERGLYWLHLQVAPYPALCPVQNPFLCLSASLLN